MRAADLAEATKVVNRITELDSLAQRGIDRPMLRVAPGQAGHYVDAPVSRRLRAIIDREWRADLAAERAEHVRRLAQLGVSL